jgi:hypothetical protein
VDTLHLSFRESSELGCLDLVQELGDVIDALGLSGGLTARSRGLFGFQNGVTFTAGVLVDWTPRDGEGPNAGYLSMQAKGDFFSSLGAEESALALVLLSDLKPKSCTRIDLQMTHCSGPLVPQIIRDYRAGRLRTRQKKHFEPKGAEVKGGEYPKGATLCHGSRQSENYARQYDKHLEELGKGAPNPGPPRRRDEIELKGLTAQAVWEELVAAVTADADASSPSWMAEARQAKQYLRHYLPIRDTSQWEGQDLPVNWAGKAQEPAWWAEHFSEEAVRARRRRGPSTTLLKRLGYMHKHFGGLYLQGLVLKQLEGEQLFDDWQVASEWAQCSARDRMVAHASERKLEELLDNLPVTEHERATELWWAYVRAAADGDDGERS